MFIAASFVIIKPMEAAKGKCPFIDEWMNKLKYISDKRNTIYLFPLLLLLFLLSRATPAAYGSFKARGSI